MNKVYSNHHMRIRTAGVQFMRFIESNTKNSWLRYLNMSTQGTWADALIIQTVADVFKVTIQIIESNQGFAPFTLPLFTQFRKEILRLQLL